MSTEVLHSRVVRKRLDRCVERALRDYAHAIQSPGLAETPVYVGRPRNRRLAAIVRDMSSNIISAKDRRPFDKFAAALGNCGQLLPRRTKNGMEELPMRCRRHLPCRSCAAIRSLQLAESDAARVLLAYRSNPSLHFALLTLLVPESDDLMPQLNHLRSGIRRLSKAEYAGDTVIAGGVWQVEVAQSIHSRYRAHAHITVAVTNPSLDALVAVLMHWVDTTQPGLPTHKRRCAILAQHATLFWAHETSATLGAPLLELELARDAYAVSIYGSRSKSLSPHESLWAYAGVDGSKLRDTWGVLRGHKEANLDRVVSEIDGAGCLRRTDDASGGGAANSAPTRSKKLGSRTRRRKRELLRWRLDADRAMRRIELHGRASARPSRGPKARCAIPGRSHPRTPPTTEAPAPCRSPQSATPDARRSPLS